MAQKYYAVKVGLTPGIYHSWDECAEMVQGFSGAIYKSFSSLDDAKAFLGEETASEKEDGYAFVDGSYNEAESMYGYGGFLIYQGEKHLLSGSGKEAEMASMRNVAGEILGCMSAVELAISLGMKELTVYYDYLGIEMWATGAWKRNKKGTVEYYNFMQSIKDKISIRFIKVKGHSGVEGNEEADFLAKKAVGIE